MKKLWGNFLKLWGDDRFVIAFWLGTIVVFELYIGFLGGFFGGILGALIGSVVVNIFDLERCIYFGIEMDAVPR